MAPRPGRPILQGAFAAVALLVLASSAVAQQRPVNPESQALIADTTIRAIDSLARADSLALYAAAPADTMGAVRNYLAEVRAGFTPENRAYWTTRVVLELVALLYGIAVGLFLL